MAGLLEGVVLSIVYGVIGLAFLICGYFLFDKVLKALDFNEELKKGNKAVGIVIAGFMIAIAIIIGGVVA
ncbi:MAG: DUF350 domain-containing protein [Cellulosilyticaceae bacterium]